MFTFEAHHIPQRKAVMGGDQVNRGVWRPVIMLVEIAGGGKAADKVAVADVAMQPVTTCGVAKLIVPLGKRRRKTANLIAIRADIPGFRNQLDLREQRTGAYRLEKGCIMLVIGRTTQYRCEVKAEAVDVADPHPVAQRL